MCYRCVFLMEGTMASKLRHVAFVTALALGGGASAATIVKVDVPHSKYVTIQSMNTGGTVIGWYRGKHHQYQSFIRTPDGQVTTFQYPDARSTMAVDINAAGVSVGSYFPADGSEHGFIRAADGSFTSIDYDGFAVTPVRINSSGVVAGVYSYHGNYGFVRDADGTMETFAPQGSIDTAVRDMNKDGVIVGDFLDSAHKTHGFVRTPDGTITPIDVPVPAAETTITSINANGEMAGSYRASGELRFGHAFFRDAAGNYTFFSAGTGDTLTTSIDNDRDITGVFFTGDLTLGYIYRAGGRVATFRIGPAPTHAVYPRRVVNGGTTAGTVATKNLTRAQGFLRIP
jgi:hypothetical protein